MRHVTCPLCEALCGLELEIDGDRVTKVRGHTADVLSAGHICPKGVAIQDLHHDPDRLRHPMRRTASGWEEISWNEALEEAASRLHAVRKAHGRHAVGVYLGNPNAHHYGNLLTAAFFSKTLRTHNRFSATSADQLPQMHAAWRLFGHPLLLPVPDLDRTELLVLFGANPWASNGSLMSAGDVRKRIGAIQGRGGRVVVIDPRRTETAEAADEHIFIRPGTDAALALALIHVLDVEGWVDPGPWQGWTDGLEPLLALARPMTPARAEAVTGIPAASIHALARAIAQAPSAALYGRVGVCTQEHGGAAAWLIYALALLTGNLDRPGGMMFTHPAVDVVGLAKKAREAGHFAVWRSRVSDLPEFSGELPVSAMAEEIETPGDKQVRALITMAGNPVLSAPNGRRIERALGGLDTMISIDMYLNETTRHAHIVLPATGPLERDHYGLVFQALAVRNVAKYNRAVFPAPTLRDDSWIVLSLAERLLRKQGLHHMAVLARSLRQVGTRRALDLLIRTGPYGAGLNPFGAGLTLAKIEATPGGVDLGPLRSCLPGRLATETGRVQLMHPLLEEAVGHVLAQSAERPALVLVGRRQLRSNNSWMHNSLRLVKGKSRCTLLMHPDDARARTLSDGDTVALSSRVGRVEVPLELSDAIMRGVVSLPHGWGHGGKGSRQAVAEAHAGASVNDVTDDAFRDRMTGNAGFSGVPVDVVAT